MTDDTLAVKYFKFLIALFLMAVAYNLFLVPLDLVAGGSGGVAILFNHLFGTDYSVVIFIISVFMSIFAFLILDIEEVLSVLFVSVFYPLLIKLTSDITSVIIIDNSQMLIMVLFGGIISGIGQGMVFKEGLNVGGFSVLARFFNKYFKISLPLCNAVINGIIIAFGAVFMGVGLALYAIVYIVVVKYVSEKIILGESNNKTFKIISSKYEKIEKYIHSLGHDVTLYDTMGVYGGDKKKLIMTVVPNSCFMQIKDYVDAVDRKAFVFVTNTYESYKPDHAIRKRMK